MMAAFLLYSFEEFGNSTLLVTLLENRGFFIVYFVEGLLIHEGVRRVPLGTTT